MHITEYAQAAYNALENGNDVREVLHALRDSLTRRGLQGFYRRVLRALLEKLKKSEAYDIPRVIVARENDAVHNHVAIAETLRGVKAGEHETVVDPTIIGGFIVTAKGKRIDRSYKSTLLSAYRSLQE